VTPTRFVRFRCRASRGVPHDGAERHPAAVRLGTLERQERRRKGARSLTNVLLVVDRDWRQWLARGPKGVGSKI
jgi:hypothetical protein